jgi:Ca2+-binding EF-hand superfamily protein
VVGPPGAIGNSPRFGGSPVFETLDANRDGYVSAREANANQAASLAFTRADTNQDGSISESEFRSAFTSPTSR